MRKLFFGSSLISVGYVSMAYFQLRGSLGVTGSAPWPFYKKDLTFDKVTNTFFMFVKFFDFLRRCNAVQIRPMAVIKK